MKSPAALPSLLAVAFALPLQAQPIEPPPALQDLLAQKREDCAAFEAGELSVERGALVRSDLDGDGSADWVLDDGALGCSSAASLFCGTGGCMVNFAVDGVIESHLAKGWTVQRFGPLTVVLVQKHGADCGGTNLNSCVEALVWDREQRAFNSVAPRQE